jgi:hypothetical protein
MAQILTNISYLGLVQLPFLLYISIDLDNRCKRLKLLLQFSLTPDNLSLRFVEFPLSLVIREIIVYKVD